MKIWTLSDLHCEFAPWEPPAIPDADVCVLAGDIAKGGIQSIEWARYHIGKHMPCVQVFGNHEYYGSSIERESKLGMDYSQNAGVHLLENSSVVLDGVRFLGATMWTDYNLFAKGDPGGQMQARATARFGIQDHQSITLRDFSRDRFAPEDAQAFHEASLAWLEGELATEHDGDTVVITHHCPSPQSVATRFQRELLSAAFASDLEPLIERYQPSAWIHGHTHDSYDYEIGATRVICNPRGYPAEKRANLQEPENAAFNPAMVIEIGEPRPKPPGM